MPGKNRTKPYVVPEIHRIVVIGDSLSDPGNMKARRLAGAIKVPGTGLDQSGTGRFADGNIWADFVAGARVTEALDEIRADHPDFRANIDAFADNFNRQLTARSHVIQCEGMELARNYAEGGATAARYNLFASVAEEVFEEIEELPHTVKTFLVEHSAGNIWSKIKNKFWDVIENIRDFFSTAAAIGAQGVVKNIRDERRQFFADEKKAKSTRDYKDKTLVVEWSGANDLVTVNLEIVDEPEDVRRAVNARIKNLSRLYYQGYRNVILANMPDLSLIPGFAGDGPMPGSEMTKEQYRAKFSAVVATFNRELRKKFNAFKGKHKDFKGEIFDAHARFGKIYEAPQDYGFTPERKEGCLVEDENFVPVCEVSPLNPEGYMFWNPFHPASRLHEILAGEFILFAKAQKFSFDESKAALVKHIKAKVIRQDYLVDQQRAESSAAVLQQLTRAAQQASQAAERLEAVVARLENLPAADRGVRTSAAGAVTDAKGTLFAAEFAVVPQGLEPGAANAAAAIEEHEGVEHEEGGAPAPRTPTAAAVV